MMRIAITYENGEVFQHFGHTEQFKLYKIDHGVIVGEAILPTDGAHCGALATLLAENGVDTLICGNIGGGAKAAVERAGLMLFPGVTGSADEAAKAFAAGILQFDPTTQCAAHEEGHHCHGEEGVC